MSECLFRLCGTSAWKKVFLKSSSICEASPPAVISSSCALFFWVLLVGSGREKNPPRKAAASAKTCLPAAFTHSARSIVYFDAWWFWERMILPEKLLPLQNMPSGCVYPFGALDCVFWRLMKENSPEKELPHFRNTPSGWDFLILYPTWKGWAWASLELSVIYIVT